MNLSNIICEHPIKAIWDGTYNKDTGKKRLTIVREQYEPTNNERVFYIPCGRCRGCRLHKASVWADRLLCELQYHDQACFITLTYNDQHLPERLWTRKYDCEMYHSPVHSLKIKDFQDFMKRLRKKFKDRKIRFYMAAEYGSLNKRPHFHVILFGTDFHEDRKYKGLVNGFPHYESPTLNKLWSVNGEQIGFADIAQVSWNDCAYVARYCMKKSIDDPYHYYDKEYYELGYIPEFSTMSRKPGIAYQYFVDNAYEIYFTGSFLTTEKGSKRIKPNNYFDKLLDYNNPDLMAQISEERKVVMWQHELEQRENTDKTYEERLSDAVVEHRGIENKLIRMYDRSV